MKRFVYTCDHCKREFPEAKINEDVPIECGHARYDCDLCDACITELRYMLRSFVDATKEVDDGRDQVDQTCDKSV